MSSAQPGIPRPLAVRAIAMLVGLLCAWQAAACTRTGGTRERRESLTPVRSDTLPESDSLFLGAAGYLVTDSAGVLYVSDVAAHRILAINRQTGVMRVFGGPGGGPGEFLSTGLVFLLPGDTVLGAVDGKRQAVNFYRTSDERFLYSRSLQGWKAYSAASLNGATLVGSLSPVGERPPRAIERLGDSTGDFLIPAPASYASMAGDSVPSPIVVLEQVRISAANGRLLAVFGAEDTLHEFTLDGGLIRSVGIPTEHRHGVSDATLRTLVAPTAAQLAGMSFQHILESVSAPRAVARLSDSTVAVVFVDQMVNGPLITARIWVSKFSPQLDRACIDIEVPTQRDSRPAIAFRADTLFVLEQFLTDDGQVESTLNAYLPRQIRCDAQAIRKPRD